MFRLANDKRLTVENLGCFIDKHREIVQNRYNPLMDAYRTKYPDLLKNHQKKMVSFSCDAVCASEPLALLSAPSASPSAKSCNLKKSF